MSKICETDGLSSVRGEEGVCDVNEHECMQVHVECVWEGARGRGEGGGGGWCKSAKVRES